MTSVSPTGSPSKRSIASRFAPSTSFKTSGFPSSHLVRSCASCTQTLRRGTRSIFAITGFAVPVVASGNLWTPHRPREWGLGRKQP